MPMEYLTKGASNTFRADALETTLDFYTDTLIFARI